MKTNYLVTLGLLLSLTIPYAHADDIPADGVKPTPAPEKTEEPKPEVVPIRCKKGREVRTLEKTAMEGGGCEVLYEKKGEKKPVAQAKNDLTVCDKVIDKMKNTLTQSGFKCE